jgi:hypothetical protein
MQKASSKLRKIGILFDDLTMSQKTWLAIEQCHKELQYGNNFDPVLFIKNMSIPCVRPRFGTLFIHEMWHFDGVLVATDLESAEQLTKVVSKAKKIFYVWDLEWIRNKKDFVYNVDIYRNPELKLVARSLNHANEITRYSGRNIDSINTNFNIQKLLELYNG